MLALISPWLLALLLFIVPAVPWRTKRWLKAAEEDSAAPSRLARHLRSLTADRDAGMELRVFGLQDEIVSRYRAAWLASSGRCLRQNDALLSLARSASLCSR